MSENILCWNARGVMNKATQDFLKSIMQQHRIDMCAIIEPMSKPENIEQLSISLNLRNYLQCSPINNQIWILWNDKIQVQEINHNPQQISLDVTLIQEEVNVMCSFVYGHIDVNERRDLWASLSDLADTCDKPWIICGDFNAILAWSEKQGGKEKNGRSIRDFSDFISYAGVTDISYKGNEFTWCNNQEGNGQIWERLDRCLVNGLGLAMFPCIENHHLLRQCSDHCPLLIKLKGDVKRRKGAFRFLGAWLEHEEFFEVVHKCWAGEAHKNPLLNVALKLKRLRHTLRQWNWTKFGDVNTKSKQLATKIEKLEADIQSGARDVTMEEVREHKASLAKISRYQFLMLEEKSKHKWFAEGDRNTSFFHASIKARRVHNTMKLELPGGTYTEDADTIGDKAVTYFESLFGSFPDADDSDVSSTVDRKITDEENFRLTNPPDEEEIKNAVFGMNASSSPGPDGFSGKFFCACWSIIKHDVVRAVTGFFYGLQLPKQISSAQIILLPKVKNAVSFDKVRPISLCNFAHKILSRILNDRLKVLLPSLISEEQAGFVKGRNIHETIGLAHEMVNDINNKTFGGNIVVKLDMSKAYDRLS
ncbi:unnamed protein product [Rhodiola kirilowii]